MVGLSSRPQISFRPPERPDFRPSGLTVDWHPTSEPMSLPQLIVPGEVQGTRTFIPSLTMVWGVRGAGKSLFMSALGKMMLDRYYEHGLRSRRRGHRIVSNYHVSYADTSHPKVVDALVGFPAWAQYLFVMVDELDAYFPSGRAMTKVSLTFNTFIKQIRKRGIELIFTTQFPQEIDRRILRQVDFFVKPVLVNRRRDMKIKVWDWWGKFSGDYRQKYWPPIEDPSDSRYTPPDWEWLIFNINSVFNQYRTDEVVAPIWSESRDSILAGQWEDLVNEDIARAEEEVEAMEANAPKPPDIRGLKDLLEAQPPEGFYLGQIFTAAQKFDSTIKNVRHLAEKARNFGFVVFEDKPRGYRAERP